MNEETNLQQLIEEMVGEVLSCNQNAFEPFFIALMTSYQTEEYKKFPVPLIFLMVEAFEKTYCANELIDSIMTSIKTYHIVHILENMCTKEVHISEIDDLECDTQLKFGGD